MDRIEVTHADLIEALMSAERASSAPEGAFTAAELERMLGMGRDKLYRKLRALVAENRVESMQVRRNDITGRPVAVPAYRLTA